SGLAVRFMEPGGSAAPQRARFIVSVLPIDIPDSLVAKAKERSRLADSMGDEAQSEIEPRGYYAPRSGTAIADSSELAAMTDSAWNANFGAWTDNVLRIRLGTSRTSSNGFQARRGTSIEAGMYSRSAGHIIWRSEAVGRGTNWGFHEPVHTGMDGRIPDPTARDVFEPKEVVLEKSLRNAV